MINVLCYIVLVIIFQKYIPKHLDGIRFLKFASNNPAEMGAGEGGVHAWGQVCGYDNKTRQLMILGNGYVGWDPHTAIATTSTFVICLDFH